MPIINSQLISPLEYEVLYTVSSQRSQEIYNEVLKIANQSKDQTQTLTGLDEKKIEQIFQQAIVENDINLALKEAEENLQKTHPKTKFSNLKVDPKSIWIGKNRPKTSFGASSEFFAAGSHFTIFCKSEMTVDIFI